jgi:hypothetical protein
MPGFTVLSVSPSARRREALRKALNGKPGAALWRFASTEDITVEKVLHTPIWYSCEKDDPDPLVKGDPA